MAAPVFHVGTFLLFVAAVLLLISTLSAPVIHSVGFLKVELANSDNGATFGTFGSCYLGEERFGLWNDRDDCSGSHLGYDLARQAGRVSGTNYDSRSVRAMTKTLVLHPIACAIAFIAFFMALFARSIGFIFASAVAAVAWAITLVALAIDFTLFGRVLRHINNDRNSSRARYGVAIWLVLAAFIALTIGVVATCLACFSDRRRSTGKSSSHHHSRTTRTTRY